MLHRRGFVLGSAGAAVLAAAGAAVPFMEPIDAALRAAVGTRAEVAGIVAAIVDENGARMTSYGSSGVPKLAMNGDTVFEIMSITKVLTAALLTDMVQRGEVEFDDPVARYLPIKLHENGGAITLLDLATYSSGLPYMPTNLPKDWYVQPNPLRNYAEADLFSFLADYVPKYAPGKHYEYANLGYGLLGVALARRAGKNYEDLLVERICGPLGLAHTRSALTGDMRRHMAQGHDVDLKPMQPLDWPTLRGAGDMRSTAKDLTVFLKANMGLVHTSLPLQRMRDTRRPTDLPGTDAALGWFVTTDKGEQIVWKTGLGAGFNTFIGFSPQRRRGAILLANFFWLPIDSGTINMGAKLIKPDFSPVNFDLLYSWIPKPDKK
jgi:CubicO group peptidase (beta-lactamase class C family)